jgi:hypothetical protein
MASLSFKTISRSQLPLSYNSIQGWVGSLELADRLAILAERANLADNQG